MVRIWTACSREQRGTSAQSMARSTREVGIGCDVKHPELPSLDPRQSYVVFASSRTLPSNINRPSCYRRILLLDHTHYSFRMFTTCAFLVFQHEFLCLLFASFTAMLRTGSDLYIRTRPYAHQRGKQLLIAVAIRGFQYSIFEKVFPCAASPGV